MKDRGGRFLSALKDEVSTPKIDDRTDLIQDLVSIIYSFSARLYGRRRAERAQRIVRLLEEGGSDGEQD